MIIKIVIKITMIFVPLLFVWGQQVIPIYLLKTSIKMFLNILCLTLTPHEYLGVLLLHSRNTRNCWAQPGHALLPPLVAFYKVCPADSPPGKRIVSMSERHAWWISWLKFAIYTECSPESFINLWLGYRSMCWGDAVIIGDLQETNLYSTWQVETLNGHQVWFKIRLTTPRLL